MNAAHPVNSLKISMVGESALLFETAGPTSDAAQQKFLRMGELANEWPSVREAVPGMNNLLVIFNSREKTAAELTQAFEAAWTATTGGSAQGKLVEIPVVYGGDAGLDLAEWAEHAGLSVEAAVQLHSQAIYSVYFLGAHPGFAYLGGLDPKIHMPRRKTPRQQIAQGTVAIGGGQAGVVAQTTPSGWNLIGSTSTRFFDAQSARPALLEPGDRVQFRCIGIQ